MYLIERMTSILIFDLILLIIFLILMKTNTQKSKKVLTLYIILLAIMAFLYIPSETADLHRLLLLSKKYYITKNIPEIISYAFTSNKPIEVLYLYIFGKIGIDGLLPATTSTIFYGIVFSILYKFAIKYNIKNINVAWTLLFFMLGGQYIEVISNIRCLLSFSLVALCLYREIIENKNITKNILLYLMATFLHSAAIGIIAIRMLYLLFQKGKNGKRSIWNFIIFVAIAAIFMTLGLKYTEASYNKLLLYLTNDVYSYTWEYVIAGLNVLYIIITLRNLKKLNKKEKIMDEKLTNLYKFIIFFTILLVISIPIYSIFHRFRTFLMIVFIPLQLLFLQKIDDLKNKYDFSKYRTITIAVYLVLFLLISFRGNLSGLKFFVFNTLGG